MRETEFDPATFAPTFTNAALGLLWYAGDDWCRVGMLAEAVQGAEMVLESLRPAFAPLLEVRDA